MTPATNRSTRAVSKTRRLWRRASSSSLRSHRRAARSSTGWRRQTSSRRRARLRATQGRSRGSPTATTSAERCARRADECHFEPPAAAQTDRRRCGQRLPESLQRAPRGTMRDRAPRIEASATKPDQLVAEVAAACEDHRRVSGAHAFDHLVVSLRTPRLDDRGDARVERGLRTVRKWEERIRSKHGAARVMTMLARLLECEADCVDAARLAATDADRGELLREHDRVRADVLAHAPREDEVSPARLVGLAADDGHALAIVDVRVTVLDEQSAEDALEVALATWEAAPLAIAEDPDRLLAPESGECLVVVVGCE